MKQVGRHSGVSVSVKEKDQIEEYDIDHEITSTISEIDQVIDLSDLGLVLTEKLPNRSLIIKACINHLVEKL